VEVKIGVREVPREVVVESGASPEDVTNLVAEAIESGTLLKLTDDKGRLVLIPASQIGYVEIGAPESRRVGFGTL
jgi:hypothetical protein